MAYTPDHINVTIEGPALDKIRDIFLAKLVEVAAEQADLVTLTAWMADNDYTVDDIAYAVEKPHKYVDELAQAKAALEAEAQR